MSIVVCLYVYCLGHNILDIRTILGASKVSANLYCNSRTSVLGRLRDYLRLLMKRSVHAWSEIGNLISLRRLFSWAFLKFLLYFLTTKITFWRDQINSQFACRKSTECIKNRIFLYPVSIRLNTNFCIWRLVIFIPGGLLDIRDLLYAKIVNLPDIRIFIWPDTEHIKFIVVTL